MKHTFLRKVSCQTRFLRGLLFGGLLPRGSSRRGLQGVECRRVGEGAGQHRGRTP